MKLEHGKYYWIRAFDDDREWTIVSFEKRRKIGNRFYFTDGGTIRVSETFEIDYKEVKRKPR